ncbi:selenocysteine-specific translation elongation factor [Tumebacillus permanentifrigoris]|uniref:Selenocysteine-specific elongation factor n=1 Tax=Tumebacillus permanentifrigoris TaxID=378543 RepID=A0A316D853_9BACL|nr:selenocysteine-specific translation elongation factor [Tumebacillus permanentifrigoris]PWK13029.1 selenocysteine-specific translation elongation factor SelB [Tumebacillus permanentifrigoris]
MTEPFIILGTAGHIDHGKTSLVKALTGIDTDIHKEEQERGITIDIGFAPFTLPDGKRLGVIDVPGHERFIRNMLAGAGGIDLILLVIDANEGIMPQTVEHLHILEMLHVQKGIIVLTKTDTVEEEWLEMVTEEVREGLTGTFLAEATIVPVSAHTGAGIEALRALIGELATTVKPREVTAPLRVPVDRVFSVPGFGTVATGTVFSGTVATGDVVELLPAGSSARVRTIQVHGQTVDHAQAGQRAALNLAGVERADLERGMVIAKPDVYEPTKLLDVRLHLLADSPRTLTNSARIRFYIGASEVLGRVSILERDELLPGEDGLVQIQLESQVVCAPQDRFIVRTYSPMLTIGGGTVIDPAPTRAHRRRRDYVLDELLQREQGGPEQLILHALLEEPGLGRAQIATEVKLTEDVVAQWLATLQEHGNVVEINGGYVAAEWLGRVLDEVEEKVRAHFAKEKYQLTVPKAHVVSQLSKKLKPKLFDALLATGVGQERFEIVRDKVGIRGYEVPFTRRDKELVQQITALYQAGQFQPPSTEDVRTQTHALDKTLHGLLHYLKERGTLVELDAGVYLHSEFLELAKRTLREKFAQTGAYSVADFRDWVGTSRKFAVLILEYLDAIKFSKRVEDKRVLV